MIGSAVQYDAPPSPVEPGCRSFSLDIVSQCDVVARFSRPVRTEMSWFALAEGAKALGSWVARWLH